MNLYMRIQKLKSKEIVMKDFNEPSNIFIWHCHNLDNALGATGEMRENRIVKKRKCVGVF